MRQPNDALPKWAKGFLRIVCPDYLIEEIEGDLVQKYDFDIRQYGPGRARRKLFWNIFRFFRPGIFSRKKFSLQFTQLMMLRNYFTTALRVSRRQGMYTFINVLGLSLGLSVTLLISIYIADELSFDKFIPDGKKIYRVGINETFKGDEILYSDTGAPVADAMRRELTGVADVVRVRLMERVVKYDEKSFIEKQFLMADSNFFKFFGYDLVEGNINECLKGPDKIVLSVSTARKYFDYDGTPATSPVGKQMMIGLQGDATEITGIFNDVPVNTHMKFDMVNSLESFEWLNRAGWGNYGYKTYFKTTTEPADMSEIENKLQSFAQLNIIPIIEKDLGISHEQFLKSGDIVSFFVQPLLSIHLESHIDSEFEPNGDLRYVYIFGAVGIFLVIIACINFMNLSTARAMGRGREVGVRKTMGATWKGLVPQFMMESFLYVITSAILAIVFAYLALGPFNSLSGKDLHIDLFSDLYIVLYVITFLAIVGVLAGTYPAFYLSSFNPVAVLKSGKLQGSPRSLLRSSLVVFQFAISTVLIIGTMIIYKQVQFIRNHDLGFEKENILRMSESFVLKENYTAFKEELLRESGFINASYSEALPPNIQSTGFIKEKGSDQLVSVFLDGTDHDFGKTMGYEMKSGRYFSKDFISDSNAVVINESCARRLGFDTHEGKRIEFSRDRSYEVIGIIKDFNFASLKSNIQPLLFYLSPETRGNLIARMTPGNPTEKLEKAEEIWKKYANGQPFTYSFLDEDYDALFRAEQRLGSVFIVLTSLAIVIACLGLFGLITFTAAQRTKEIGIRKVLGASQGQLTWLLLSDLGKLLLISFVIAIPLAWYGMTTWLESFAYRTNFDVFSVLIAGLTAIVIALVTVGYRSMRAASVNPVESLKNE